MPITQIGGRYDDMMRTPRSWRPPPPKIRFNEKGKFLYTRMTLVVSPGVTMNFTSRVDLELVEKNLRDGARDEISGIFGSIFRGIKKAVKTVGKATGLNKVVKFAGKVLNNPLIKAVVPGAAAAAAGVKIASDVAKATGITRGGKRSRGRRGKAAKYYLTRAAVTARRSGLDRGSRESALKTGGQMYRAILTPM